MDDGTSSPRVPGVAGHGPATGGRPTPRAGSSATDALPHRHGRPVIRILTWILLGLLGLAGVIGLAVAAAWVWYHPAFELEKGVVYGERRGKPLLLDVVRPAKPNGLAIVYFTSGGWRSGGPGDFSPVALAPLLRRGYTIFPVYHVSQPEATIMEIVDDMHRAVRFVRAHAADYRLDPDRIGVTGGSAGGHLALMIATRGGPGDPAAADPVDRVSSAVQAVAIFYPVTDMTNLRGSTEDPGDGGPPKNFRAALDQEPVDMDRWRTTGPALSPIRFVSPATPPTLIFHGDADTLVPLDQSERYRAAARDVGADVELVVHPGGGHGWPTMIVDLIRFGGWFDRHLRPGG